MKRYRHTVLKHASALFGAIWLSLASPSGAQQPSALSETYGDWIVKCAQVSDDGSGTTDRACHIVQDLLQQGSLQRIIAIEVSPGEGGSRRLTLVAPFGLLLSEGVSLSVEEETLANVSFRTCLPVGCIGHLDLSDDLIGHLRAGNTLTLTMMSDADQQLSFEMSLTGFTRAEARMGELLPQTD